jgi:iron complex outermembrane receptor protein
VAGCKQRERAAIKTKGRLTIPRLDWFIISLATLVIVFLGEACAHAQCAKDAPQFQFNIPAGDMEPAFSAAHEQAGLSFGYDSKTVPSNTKLNAVVGRLSVCEAVSRMLAHTGLTFEWTGPVSIWIEPSARLTRETSSGFEVRHQGSRVIEAPGAFAGDTPLDEVVVTGSHLRGTQDSAVSLIRLDATDLANAPIASVQDALRYLPFNFGGGPRAVFDPQGAISAAGNFNAGEAIDLRGAGTGATLVLVDGRHQPGAGEYGDFVDVRNIPWSAVDRIEIVTDGASALYGSDAIAGVVNIILRKDFDGIESQVRLGSARAGDREALVDTLAGTHWNSGKVLVAYQFVRDTPLTAAANAYSATTDKTPFGGADFRSDYANPGNILNPLTLAPEYAIPTGSHGTLTPTQLLPNVVNLQNQLADVDLLPATQMHSLWLTASQQLGDQIELFGESRFSLQDIDRLYPAQAQALIVPPNNPYNPFPQQPFTVVGYSFLNDLGPIVSTGHTTNLEEAGGVNVALADGWRGTLSGSYARAVTTTVLTNTVNPATLATALADSDPATAFNPFGDGSYTNPNTLASIRTTQRFRTVSSLAGIEALTDGILFKLPSGAVRAALGSSIRWEGLDQDVVVPPSYHTGRYSRTISAIFTELALPLVGRSATWTSGPPRLALSLAGRAEHYSDVGVTATPHLALTWVPSQQIQFRGTWGTSFRAPTLNDEYNTANNVSGLARVMDPQSPSGQSVVLIEQGSNPHLHNETATTWTAGAVFTPTEIPDLTASLTYYATLYRNRIFEPGAPLTLEQILSDPQWSPLVNRTPTPAQIDAICNSNTFLGSPGQCTATRPAAIIDTLFTNLSTTQYSGIDWRTQKLFSSPFGQFKTALEGTYVTRFSQQVTPLAPVDNVLNTLGNPLRLRFRATVGWAQHGVNLPGMAIEATVDYSNAYRDVSVEPGVPVASWTVTNFNWSFRTRDGPEWEDNLEIGVNVANAFDRAPPFANRWIGYDAANADDLGRIVSAHIRKRW